MSAIPTEAFADFTRAMAERHSEWDSPHAFSTLVADGHDIRLGTFAMIDPSIHPTLYPAVIAQLVEQLVDKERTPDIVGYALQIEAYSVIPPVDPSPEEETRLMRDRVERRFHERDDAQETLLVFCVDLEGRLWSATKFRNRPDRIREAFDEDARDGAHKGPFVAALADAAETTRRSV